MNTQIQWAIDALNEEKGRLNDAITTLQKNYGIGLITFTEYLSQDIMAKAAYLQKHNEVLAKGEQEMGEEFISLLNNYL